MKNKRRGTADTMQKRSLMKGWLGNNTMVSEKS